MKEKITITLVLTATLSLLIYHQSQTNEVAGKTKNTSPTPLVQSETITDNIVESQPIVDVNLTSNTFSEHSENETCDECELEIAETDQYPFSEAFKHYRQCLGIGEIFTWNGVDYLIEIAEEQETLFADSVNVDQEQVSQK